MNTAKLGIIGLGYIGQLHLKHGLKLSNAEVVAVADSAPQALEKAKEMGIKKTYLDYTELLKDPLIDAVVISLPTHLHLACAQLAAEDKKDIFLEKPIAVNVAEAKEVISAAERNSVKLMIGYPLRFNKNFLKLKADMENGLIGDIENAHAIYVSCGPFFHRADGHSPSPVPEWWFNTKLTGGGVLMDLGCHMINLLRMLFGEVVEIKSQLGHRFNMDFEDSAMCLAKFSSGTVVALNVGWYSQEYLLRLDVLGSVRNVSVSHMPASTIATAYQLLTRGTTSFIQPHFDELQHFVNCITNDKVPCSTGLDGLRDLEVISKAYKNPIDL
ncbi:MAG: Gfo/Idh/MocA family oxidoreductase [Candidatus Bathyarchaeota archaeon]|nr:Gfo/Idh/MocA family oxidoreductase [Candidatus Bathyarchaeota archaeon]